MTDNRYNTEPMGPPQQPQGKLILGSFQQDAQNGPPPRRPYQYQPLPPQTPQPPPSWAPPQPQQQGYVPGPVADPKRSPYPYQQQPWQGGSPQSRRYRPKRRKGSGCLVATAIVLAVLVVLGTIAFTTAQRALAFGSAISPKAPLSTQTGYMTTTDRTNLLVLGFGGGGHDGAYLTDSMSIISVQPTNRHTSLVAVPRDLWVQNPPNSGQYSKINAVYEVASNNNQNPIAGGDAAAQKVSLVTGLNVKYWMTINFTGFRELIDSIGGVDVYVPDSFNACYPKNDDANVDPSWKKVQFNKGMQHMNGETAIEFARAREPLDVCGMGTSMNQAELSDFARSARQQIIIKAMIAKVRQVSTWPKMLNAMTALQHTIYTNMSFADLAAFSLKMDLNDPHTAHIGLSNQNVLTDSQSSDGQYILLPANNNWQAIADYVKQHLYA